MTGKTSPADVRLYVRFDDSRYGGYDSDRFAHVTAQPLILARDRYGNHELTLHDPDSYGIEDPGAAVRALKGLTVRAQTDGSSHGFYGYEIVYKLDEVPLRTAETMLPVLRRLDKKMTALADRFGRPQDLAGYLAHLADALGLGGQPFMRPLNADEADYEGTGYRAMDADGLRWWIADETAKWRERHGIETPAA
jgi:hypothetical protein